MKLRNKLPIRISRTTLEFPEGHTLPEGTVFTLLHISEKGACLSVPGAKPRTIPLDVFRLAFVDGVFNA